MTEIYCCKFCSMHIHSYINIEFARVNEVANPVIYDVLNCAFFLFDTFFFANLLKGVFFLLLKIFLEDTNRYSIHLKKYTFSL